MSPPRVLVEKTGKGFSAWSPDLPGCIATAVTEDEVRERLTGAIAMHLEGLRKAGIEVPPVAG